MICLVMYNDVRHVSGISYLFHLHLSAEIIPGDKGNSVKKHKTKKIRSKNPGTCLKVQGQKLKLVLCSCKLRSGL